MRKMLRSRLLTSVIVSQFVVLGLYWFFQADDRLAMKVVNSIRDQDFDAYYELQHPLAKDWFREQEGLLELDFEKVLVDSCRANFLATLDSDIEIVFERKAVLHPYTKEILMQAYGTARLGEIHMRFQIDKIRTTEYSFLVKRSLAGLRILPMPYRWETYGRLTMPNELFQSLWRHNQEKKRRIWKGK